MRLSKESSTVLPAEGRAMGFSTDTLLRVGGFFNHKVGTGAYGDDIEDSFMIKLGAEYYDTLYAKPYP